MAENANKYKTKYKGQCAIQTKVSNQNKTITFTLVRFPGSCKIEVKWIFGHLDTNHDGYLSFNEVYDLEHDQVVEFLLTFFLTSAKIFLQNEKCIQPFINHCDLDKNNVLNTLEWCHCFYKSNRPCAAFREALHRVGGSSDSYIPLCDDQGFYQHEQCFQSECWCVDKHGVRVLHKKKCSKYTQTLRNCFCLIFCQFFCTDEITANTDLTLLTDDEDDRADGEYGSAEKLLVF